MGITRCKELNGMLITWRLISDALELSIDICNPDRFSKTICGIRTQEAFTAGT